MHCIECHLPISHPSLQVAMEQREHFALTRHVELCPTCAMKAYLFVEKHAGDNQHWRQSLNCCYCGHNLPIARFRFEIGERVHKHLAICEKCYERLRSDMMIAAPATVSFIEKEWQTPGHVQGHRLPWPKGATVRVNPRDKRFGGRYGIVRGFRGLVQPWFGYDVEFAHNQHHFFHERDLLLLDEKQLQATPPEKPVTDSAS